MELTNSISLPPPLSSEIAQSLVGAKKDQNGSMKPFTLLYACGKVVEFSLVGTQSPTHSSSVRSFHPIRKWQRHNSSRTIQFISMFLVSNLAARPPRTRKYVRTGGRKKECRKKGPFKKSPAGNDLLLLRATAGWLLATTPFWTWKAFPTTPSDNKNLNGKLLDPKI